MSGRVSIYAEELSFRLAVGVSDYMMGYFRINGAFRLVKEDSGDALEIFLFHMKY